MVAAVSIGSSARVDIACVPKALPDRFRAVWTEHEKDVLRMMWGVHPIVQIARRLDRTATAIYRMAGKLELGVGCPRGFEYVRCAAVRAGYAQETMVMILRWAGVRLWMPSSDPAARGTNPERVVDPSEVDDAVKAWCATETLVWAAERYGVCAMTVLRVLRAAEARGDLVLPKHVDRKHWRILTTDIDRAMAAYRGRERARDAAKRYGLNQQTMCNWLHEAGVVFDLKTHWLTREVIDRVVAERRATETLSASARRLGIRPGKLSRWLAEVGIRWPAKSPPHVVDEIVAKKLALESIASAAVRVGVSSDMMRAWLRRSGVVRPRGAERRWLDPSAVDEAARLGALSRRRRCRGRGRARAANSPAPEATQTTL